MVGNEFVVPDDMHSRVQAMQMAVSNLPPERMDSSPNPAGQTQAGWNDVSSYWKSVGGQALRSIGVKQEDVRYMGLV